MDETQIYHAANALLTRSLKRAIGLGHVLNDSADSYFNDCRFLLCCLLRHQGEWMSEDEIFSRWPVDVEEPHIMRRDNILRTMAFSGAADVDATQVSGKGTPMGWTKYKAPSVPHEVGVALNNFRFFGDFRECGSGVIDEVDIVVGDLFCPFPSQLGLRGDTYLWGKLASYFSTENIYAEFNLEHAMERGFEHLLNTGFNRAPEQFFNDGLAHGGMSSGVVSMQWWRSVGVRVLAQRLEVIRPALPVDVFGIAEA